ncbi:MAG TPA: chemotaxis protein CheW [Xenococcaceae cyanobacterium]
MTVFSTLRSRQFADRQNQVTEQIIAFRLLEEWFAVPILAVKKVIPLGKIYGDPNNQGISFTSYNNRELLVIDVAKYIFSGLPVSHNAETDKLLNHETELQDFNTTESKYLLILQAQNHQDIGLPIDSQPTMYRIDSSAFKALPEIYLEKSNIQYISSKIIEIPETPVMFLLDNQKLINSVIKKDI